MLFLLGGLVVGYVGLLLLTGGITSFRRNQAFDHEGVPVDAVISRFEERTQPTSNRGPGVGPSNRMTVAYYRYKTPDGREHEGNTNQFDRASALDVGSTIRVMYLPSDPDESRVKPDYGFSTLLGLAGLVMLPSGIVMMIKGAKALLRKSEQPA